MKKTVKDIMLNIFSTAIPLLILQFFALPYAAKILDTERYGVAVTIISFLSIIPISIGSALNNTKLLMSNDYETKETGDDFKILLLAGNLLNIMCMLVYLVFFIDTYNKADIVLTIIISILTVCKEFLIVHFLIKIDYKSVLINNIFLSFGYIIGIILLRKYPYWQIIYILGLTFSLGHIIKKGHFEHFKRKKTVLFSKALKQASILTICFILSKTTIYADKLLLFPLLGGTSVSVYYISSLMGKTISLGIGPVQGVLLTNLARKKEVKENLFCMAFIFSSLLGIIAYFFAVSLCKPVLRILYPQSYLDALVLLPVTTATAIISSISVLLNSFLLKLCDLKWQWGISAAGIILYIGLAYLFFFIGGIKFFCYGILLATVLKLIMIIWVYMYKRKEDVKNEILGKSV